MGREGELWREVVDTYFEFLTDAGFTTTTVDDSRWWEISVTYLTDTVALKVAASREYNRVEVELVRLVHSQMPEYQVWVTDGPLDRMLLDNVVEARRPERLAELTRHKGLSTKATARQLALFAALLGEVAPEFLTGDTSAIDDGATVVRARASEHPQEFTVHMPPNATDEQLAAEYARAVASVPPEVRVRVRRYGWRRLGRRRLHD